MKRFFTVSLLLCICLGTTAQSSNFLPYNPDSDSDGWIGINDLLELLAIYSSAFETDSWVTDSTSAHVILPEERGYLQCWSDCNSLEGRWRMVTLTEFGKAFGLAENNPQASYWLDSQKSVESTSKLICAESDGTIFSQEVASATSNQSRKCMCYVRAHEIGLPEVASLNLDSLEAEVGVALAYGDTLASQIDSLASLIEATDSDLNHPIGTKITCVELGLSLDCSPQGGLCSSTLEPDENGRYRINNYCPSDYDPDQCLDAHWRKFTLEGVNLGGVTKIFMFKWSPAANGYSGYYGQQSARSASVYDVSDTSISFYVGMQDVPDDLAYLSLGYSAYSGDERNILWTLALQNESGEVFNISPRLWMK